VADRPRRRPGRSDRDRRRSPAGAVRYLQAGREGDEDICTFRGADTATFIKLTFQVTYKE
jgi:hypothetical protein